MRLVAKTKLEPRSWEESGKIMNDMFQFETEDGLSFPNIGYVLSESIFENGIENCALYKIENNAAFRLPISVTTFDLEQSDEHGPVISGTDRYDGLERTLEGFLTAYSEKNLYKLMIEGEYEIRPSLGLSSFYRFQKMEECAEMIRCIKLRKEGKLAM